MNLGLIWRIILDNPIDGGDVETSGSDVSAEKNARLSVTKLEKCRSALRLLLFALFNQFKIFFIKVTIYRIKDRINFIR